MAADPICLHSLSPPTHTSAEHVTRHGNTTHTGQSSGCIINTCGRVEGAGLAVLGKTVEAFEADIVVVLGDAALEEGVRAELQRGRGACPRVVRFARSDCVVARSRAARVRARSERVREYFYGPGRTLRPHVVVVPFGTLKIYRVNAPTSGRARDLSLTEVPAATLALGTVLAVVNCTDPTQCLTANVAGYLVVRTKPDLAHKTLTLLSPCPGTLPSSVCLVGSLQWQN